MMATSYTGGSNDTRTDSRYTQGKTMDSIASSKSTDRNHPGLKESVGKSSPKGVNHVNFDTKEKHVEKREKYLTAKYGQHQMLLIKKRLAVEMWLFEELSRLYCTEDDDHDCNLELEEVLNLETDGERRAYVLEQLSDAKESPEEVQKFVVELLAKARTL